MKVWDVLWILREWLELELELELELGVVRAVRAILDWIPAGPRRLSPG